MPKEGYRSITVSHTVYERFNDSYSINKEVLAANGIRSITGYISNMLEDALRDEGAARWSSRLQLLHAEYGLAVMLDVDSNRVAEVSMRDGEPFCRMCENDRCLHAGFAYATHRFFLDGNRE